MTYVAEGGALAFQMPRNFDAPSHTLMRAMAEEDPWAEMLTDARRVHVLPPEDYFDMLRPHSRAIDIWETTYFHVLEGGDPVFDWVSGTGLRPFLEPLNAQEREDFSSAYRTRLRKAYPRRADGQTLLPFRRLFVVALA